MTLEVTVPGACCRRKGPCANTSVERDPALSQWDPGLDQWGAGGCCRKVRESHQGGASCYHLSRVRWSPLSRPRGLGHPQQCPNLVCTVPLSPWAKHHLSWFNHSSVWLILGRARHGERVLWGVLVDGPKRKLCHFGLYFEQPILPRGLPASEKAGCGSWSYSCLSEAAPVALLHWAAGTVNFNYTSGSIRWPW